MGKFRDKVTHEQLVAARDLFKNEKPSIKELKSLGMPEYSGISFLSKIRMFFSPTNSATLDRQIMKMKFQGYPTVLDSVSFTEKETLIRPSGANSNGYELWCEKLINISSVYFDGKYRPVDVERGFFHMIANLDQSNYAAEILNKS